MAIALIPETKENFFEENLKVTEKLPYYDSLENVSKEKLHDLAELIEYLAQNTISKLITKIFKIISLGNKVNGLHPLNSFEFILTNQNLHEKIKLIYDENRCIKSIWNPSGLIFANVRSSINNGFCYFLEKRHKDKDLEPHLDNFCHKADIPKEILIPHIQKEDWKGFIEAILLQKK